MPAIFDPLLGRLRTKDPTGSSTPGGSTTQLQYNNAGAFGGINGAVTDGTDVTFKNKILLEETGAGTDTITLQAPASITTPYTITLPIDDGSSGQVLTTDGSGVTSWTTNGVGDVVGPASSTDNALARFDLTTGKLIQNSVAILTDTGELNLGAGSLTNVSLSLGSSGANSGFYSTGVNSIDIALGGTRRWQFSSSSLRGLAGSAANPTFTTIADPDTGTFVGTGIAAGFTVDGTELGRFTTSGTTLGLLVGTTTPVNPSGITSTRGQFYNASNNVTVLSVGGGPGSGNTLAVFNTTSTAQQIRSGFITNYSVINFVNPAASGGLLQSGGNLTYDVATSSDFIWSQNSVGTVLMRLNSTGLGIGITPTTTLHVHNASGNSQIQITDGTSGSTNADGLEIGTNFSDGSMYIWNNEATALRFGTNNSERLRIDSSGNVGIGTGATVSAKLHTLATTEQLRLGYDASNYFSTTVGSTGGVTFNAVGAGSAFTFSDAVTINGSLTLSAQNIITDTTTGMKIATGTTQKLGFWNATPIVQPTTAVVAATFVANTSAIADDTATFDGYTIGQIVKALRNAGLLA